MLSAKRINTMQILGRIRQKYLPSTTGGPGPHLSATLAVEGLLFAVILNLTTTYAQMFANRMGATDDQIGLVVSLPQLMALIVLIPGAVLAGRMTNSRRPIELSIISFGILFGLAGFSPWLGSFKVWFFIAAIALANAPVALYNATWQNYFSEIVPMSERNTYYARRTAMTFLAGMLVTQLVGIVLGSVGNEALRTWLYQGCYWLALAAAIVQARTIRRAPAVMNTVQTGWRDLWLAGKALLRCRSFLVFGAASLFFHAAWYMAWPLFFLIQVNYLESNETWLALVAVPASIVQWLTVRRWSRFIERQGLRLALVIGCVGLAVNPLLAVSCAWMPSGVGLYALLVFNLINALTFGAFQLSILQSLLEDVPVRYRTINISFYTSILLLANAFAPILGVRLYALLGSDLIAMTVAMAISSGLRLIGAGLFLLRWYWQRRNPACGIVQTAEGETKT